MRSTRESLTRGPELTRRGRLTHALVLVEDQLTRHHNPDSSFSMSPQMVYHATVRKADLIFELKLDDPEAEITRLRKELIEAGHPHWRMVTHKE